MYGLINIFAIQKFHSLRWLLYFVFWERVDWISNSTKQSCSVTDGKQLIFCGFCRVDILFNQRKERSIHICGVCNGAFRNLELSRQLKRSWWKSQRLISRVHERNPSLSCKLIYQLVYESSFIWVKQSTRRDALTLLRGYVALISVQTPLPYVPNLTDGLSTQTSGVWVNLVRQF